MFPRSQLTDNRTMTKGTALKDRLDAAQSEREAQLTEARREASFAVTLYGWSSSRTERAIDAVTQMEAHR
jgi:F0F1-type ATP synthase membrane subunit b/b'